MRKICFLLFLFLLSSCSVDTVKEYNGFSVDTARNVIIFSDREFFYRLNKYPSDGSADLDIYYSYVPTSGFNTPAMRLYREESNRIVMVDGGEYYVAEDWENYDYMKVAEELLPSRTAFFTDFPTFWMKPWGIFFLFGGLFLLFPRPMSYWWIRTSRYCPEVVDYDDNVHRPLCVKYGLSFMIPSFLSWFVSQLLGKELPFFLVFVAIMVVLLQVPVPEGARPQRPER
ncbi:MAG: hypothetical protein R3Y63_00415 [Eubacteriales bacterium]